jgi:DNA invertase Pin-like site-specific DNA recombinase
MFRAPPAPEEAKKGEMICAAYVRVSTRQQDLGAQKDAIWRVAEARGDVVTLWFEEKKNANSLKRPELERLRDMVRRGMLQKLYAFKVDRLGRSGIRDTLTVVEELRANGCKLSTVADGFDFDGPSGDLVVAVMAWAAQMERQALGDRISAARERVEAAGGRWGRPRKLDPGTLARAVAMQAEGRSLRQIAVALKIARATLGDALSGKGHYAGTAEQRKISSVTGVVR